MRISLAITLALFSFATAQAQEVLESLPSGDSVMTGMNQRQWVSLDQAGAFRGKVNIFADATPQARVGAKVLLSRNSQIIRTAITGVEGDFLFEGLQPGTYAIQVAGDQTFAAQAIHLLPATGANDKVQIFAAEIPTQDAKVILASNLAPDWVPSPNGYYQDTLPPGIVPANHDTYQVALQGDELHCQVSRPGWDIAAQDLRGNVGQLVKDGVVIGRVPTAIDGTFHFDAVAPGVYALFVSGDDGYAVVAFEAVSAQQTASKTSSDGSRYVALQGGIPNVLKVELIEQSESSNLNQSEEVLSEELAPLPGAGLVGPGGFGGGGFSGGGGYGGGGVGGGLGGLAGAAGLAVGIAALADDDDGFNQNIATIIAP